MTWNDTIVYEYTVSSNSLMASRRYNDGTLDVDGESARIMNACNEMNEPRQKKG